MDLNVMESEKLPPIIKWAGGKERELKHILPLLPNFDAYYEPFVGAGAVFFSINAGRKYINDISHELFRLYLMVAEENLIFLCTLADLSLQWDNLSRLADIHSSYLAYVYSMYAKTNGPMPVYIGQQIAEWVHRNEDELKQMFVDIFPVNVENFLAETRRNLTVKMTRMRMLEREKGQLSTADIIANLEGALKSAFYMHVRHLYNNIQQYNISQPIATALFFFVREYCYASMFRYNSQGDFNVPYGGITYNKKTLARKLSRMQSPAMRQAMRNVCIGNIDFEDFLCKNAPGPEDFVFLDPPYDSDFSTYAQHYFLPGDQERLAHYLLTKCKAKWMLLIKNTPLIQRLYSDSRALIRSFDKNYSVSFMNRNNRHVEHLIITNYDI